MTPIEILGGPRRVLRLVVLLYRATGLRGCNGRLDPGDGLRPFMHAAPVVVANLLVLCAAAWTGRRSRVA